MPFNDKTVIAIFQGIYNLKLCYYRIRHYNRVLSKLS